MYKSAIQVNKYKHCSGFDAIIDWNQMRWRFVFIFQPFRNGSKWHQCTKRKRERDTRAQTHAYKQINRIECKYKLFRMAFGKGHICVHFMEISARNLIWFAIDWMRMWMHMRMCTLYVSVLDVWYKWPTGTIQLKSASIQPSESSSMSHSALYRLSLPSLRASVLFVYPPMVFVYCLLLSNI